MARISDEELRGLLACSRSYTVVILRAGPQRHADGAEKVIWEHGRRNAELRADGVLPIVCPVLDDSEVSGVGIFALDVAQARAVMDQDPGVRAGVFRYEVHPARSFPGSALPG